MRTTTRNRNPRFYTGDEERVIGDFVPNDNAPLPPDGAFLLPVCLTMDQATRLLSAASFGASLMYTDDRESVILPLLQAMEFANQPELSGCITVSNRRYRINDCRLEVSEDDGQTWTRVEGSEIALCVDDGRTPVLRALDNPDNTYTIQWRYTDEPASAWRNLITIRDGVDGLTPEFRTLAIDDRCVQVQFKYASEPPESWRTLTTVCDGVDGSVNPPSSGDTTMIYAGTIIAVAGNVIPAGTVECNGSVYQRSQYPDLYDALAPVFRISDTLFRVPDIARRVIVGSAIDYPVGMTFGVDQVSLGIANIPSHTHNVRDLGHSHPPEIHNHAFNVRINATGFGTAAPAAAAGGATQSRNTDDWPPSGTGVIPSRASAEIAQDAVGGGQAHENRQPSVVLRYVIYTENLGGKDGLTPELRSVKNSNINRIEYRYIGEASWRFLANIPDGETGSSPFVSMRVEDCVLQYRPDTNAAWEDLYDLSVNECDDDSDDVPPPTGITDENRCYASKRMVQFLERLYLDVLAIKEAEEDAYDASNEAYELVRSGVGTAIRKSPVVSVLFALFAVTDDTDDLDEIRASMTVIRRESIERALYCDGGSVFNEEDLDIIASTATQSGYGVFRGGGEFGAFVRSIGAAALRPRWNALLRNADNSCQPCGGLPSGTLIFSGSVPQGDAPTPVFTPTGAGERLAMTIVNIARDSRPGNEGYRFTGTHVSTDGGVNWQATPVFALNSLIQGTTVNGQNLNDIAILTNGVGDVNGRVFWLTSPGSSSSTPMLIRIRGNDGNPLSTAFQVEIRVR